jgi:hypothetical protein
MDEARYTALPSRKNRERSVQERTLRTRGANPIDIRKDDVVKGDTEEVDGLTVDLVPDSDGSKGRIEIVANLG